MVNRGRSGGGGGGCAARLDDGGAALLDDGDEGVLVPAVFDQAFGGFTLHGGVADVRVLGGGVVAPDGHLGDIGAVRAGFFGELRQRAVVVKAGHRREVARVKIGRGGLRDEGIGIGRVTDNQHFDVARGVVIQRLALRAENGAIRGEQILALHAGTARAGADQQGIIAVLESDVGIVSRDQAAQERESAVVEFHGNALECIQRRGDF